MDVKYVAELAKIELNSKQIKKLDSQFKDMLSFFKNLEEVDTQDVEPCAHVLPIKNVLREDEIRSEEHTSELQSH